MSEEGGGAFEDIGRTPIHRANIRHIQAVGALRSSLNPKFALERAFYAAEDLRQHLHTYDPTNAQSVRSLRELTEGASQAQRQYWESRGPAAIGMAARGVQWAGSAMGLPFTGNVVQMAEQAFAYKNADARLSLQTGGLIGQSGGAHRAPGFDALMKGAAELGRSRPEVMQFMQDVTMATGKLGEALTSTTAKMMTLSRAYGLSEGQVTASTSMGMSFGEDPQRLMAIGMAKTGSVAGTLASMGAASAMGSQQLAMFAPSTIERNMALVSSVMGTGIRAFNSSPDGIRAAGQYIAGIPGLALNGPLANPILARLGQKYGGGVDGMAEAQRLLLTHDPEATASTMELFAGMPQKMRNGLQLRYPEYAKWNGVIKEGGQKAIQMQADNIRAYGKWAASPEGKEEIQGGIIHQAMEAKYNTPQIDRINVKMLEVLLRSEEADATYRKTLQGVEKGGLGLVAGVAIGSTVVGLGTAAWAAKDRLSVIGRIVQWGRSVLNKSGPSLSTAGGSGLVDQFGNPMSSTAKSAAGIGEGRGALGRFSAKVGGAIKKWGPIAAGALEFATSRSEGSDFMDASADAIAVGGITAIGGRFAGLWGAAGSASLGMGLTRHRRDKTSTSAGSLIGNILGVQTAGAQSPNSVNMAAQAQNASVMAQEVAGGSQGSIAVLNVTAGTVNLDNKNAASSSASSSVSPTAVRDIVTGSSGFSIAGIVADISRANPKQRFGADRGDHTHQGVDISGAHGRALRALMPGVVSGITRNSESAGNMVTIDTPLGDGRTLQVKRMHLATIALKDRQRVDASTIIGTAGDTGHATQGSGVDHQEYRLIGPDGKATLLDPHSAQFLALLKQIADSTRATAGASQGGGIVATHRSAR